MSEQLRLERHLPGLLEDLYLTGSPDYRTDVLATVARTRQRPAWTFPERWLPMTDIATRPAFAPRLPIRALVLVALLLALAAALVFYVGTQQRRVPPPFGPAKNGLLVYSVNGDLFTADVLTAQSRSITSGADVERHPLMSPDGTRVAFLKAAPGAADEEWDLAVVGIDGHGLKILSPTRVAEGDPFAWAPDGSAIFLLRSDNTLVRFDAAGGPPRTIATGIYFQGNPFQPPTGGRILYEKPGGSHSLYLMNADGTGEQQIYTIPTSEEGQNCDFATVNWAPDGRHIAFTRKPAANQDQCRVFIMNADGSDAHELTKADGNWFEIDGRWSPDGTQLAFNRWGLDQTGNWRVYPIGVVSATGGGVRSIGPTPVGDGAAFEWSPDGTTIISLAGTALQWPPTTMKDAHPTIIDVKSGTSQQATWSMSSWPAWQRLAP